MTQRGKGVVTGVLMFLVGTAVSAQSVRSLVNGGNGLYEDRKYVDAEVKYRKSIEQEPSLVQGHFNLGNSLYKQGKYDESIREYQNAAQAAEMGETKAHAYYNIGNSLTQAQQYQDAVKAYVESLKLVPDDQETKYNLSYALAKLREQQQQQNKSGQGQNKQEKKDDRQQQQQQKQQQQDQQQQQERKMSKAEADRILDVLKNNEQEVQKKLRTRPATRVKPEKDW